MNWKLIFTLSLFGLAMAFITVFWVPVKSEWMFWLPIFIICAFLIARYTSENAFLHGFMVSLFNCFWILVIHLLLYHTYKTIHPEMADMNANMPLHGHPRILMVIFGILIGVLSGLVLGLFAYLASLIMRKRNIQ